MNRRAEASETVDRLEARLFELGQSFWAWRAVQQPRTADDIPRLIRPEKWLPQWSSGDVRRYRTDLYAFTAAWSDLPLPDPDGPIETRRLIVDHALLGSAIERVRFELDVNPMWRTNPGFYIDAGLGVYFDRLLQPGPFDAHRTDEILSALQHVPKTIRWAKENLAASLAAEFAELTAANLDGIEAALDASATALAPHVPADRRTSLMVLASAAADALADLREWLRDPATPRCPWSPIGDLALGDFFRTIALNPLSIRAMTDMAIAELQRAETLSAIDNLSRGSTAPIAASIGEQIERERQDELDIRSFSETTGILSQPATLHHYLVAPMPGYLEPIRWLGVTDDLTDDARVDEDAVSYMPDPAPDLPYFYEANARDPRAGIVHEGAHYQQLALSWRHERPLRRRYYDSGPNEGIAFYNEELMLRAGLFDDAPGTRHAIHSFLRLRALRVLVDLGLASGTMPITEAAALMTKRVPMDAETSTHEAAAFAATPGQGLTYQVGKNQIIAFIADATRVLGDDFVLRDVHDYLWRNGNVPIALLRYELLGLTDELDRIRL